jgi:hypothetical protein
MKVTAFAALHSFNMLAAAMAFGQHGARNHISLSTRRHSPFSTRPQLRMTIVSPFDNTEDSDESGEGVATATYTSLGSDDEPLDLTWENVDMVLEEMRPFLLQDGGNVAISEIDGPIVKLELQVRLRIMPYVYLLTGV